MTGLKVFERKQFYEYVVINELYKSKQSAYFTARYKDWACSFCISDHTGKYRGKLMYVFSKDKSKKRAKQIAFELYEKRRS